MRVQRLPTLCILRIPHAVLILGTFAKFRKAIISLSCLSFSPSVRPSVHLSVYKKELGYNWTASREICIFETLWRFKFDYNMTRIRGTFCEDLCTLVIIPRSSLVRMRNILDRLYRGNKKTRFLFNKVFPKIMRLMRKCGKIW